VNGTAAHLLGATSARPGNKLSGYNPSRVQGLSEIAAAFSTCSESLPCFQPITTSLLLSRTRELKPLRIGTNVRFEEAEKLSSRDGGFKKLDVVIFHIVEKDNPFEE